MSQKKEGQSPQVKVNSNIHYNLSFVLLFRRASSLLNYVWKDLFPENCYLFDFDFFPSSLAVVVRRVLLLYFCLTSFQRPRSGKISSSKQVTFFKGYLRVAFDKWACLDFSSYLLFQNLILSWMNGINASYKNDFSSCLHSFAILTFI